MERIRREARVVFDNMAAKFHILELTVSIMVMRFRMVAPIRYGQFLIVDASASTSAIGPFATLSAVHRQVRCQVQSDRKARRRRSRGRTGALAYDEARRIAASIAKLPELVRRKADSP